ncbi:MAG: ATP-binding protein [Chloroflexi bacterium]|nr:ATP-binding protein [Chloroflexota bacterium]
MENPYRSAPDDAYVPAPFTGRQPAFTRLYGYLNDVERTQAFVFVGRRQIGKSALLWQFDAVYGDSFVGVFAALETLPLRSESGLLLALAHLIENALIQREFTLSRVPEVPPTLENAAARNWFGGEFLPGVFRALRSNRRLILLLDNAHLLIDALAAGTLAADFGAYLAELLQAYPQLGLVLTLDETRETDLPALQPLAGEVFRLTNLKLGECAALFPAGMDAAAVTAYRATGGQPALMQRFGYYLLQSGNAKAASAQVYQASVEEFRQTWLSLTRSERLALTAISGLLYADPLAKIDADSISQWLIETDYPLDTTSINAALRSLEYREILTHSASGNALAAGLMQRWLLENARIETPPMPAARRRWWVIGTIVATLFAILLLVIALSSAPGTNPASDAPATVTLVGTP